MPQIDEKDFTRPDTVVSILDKGLHRGFIDEKSLSDKEIELERNVEWLEKAVKFRCSECGNWHATNPGKERCLQTMELVDPETIKNGFRVTADSRLNISHGTDYTLLISESSSTIDASVLPYKSIVFVPDHDDLVFADPAGSIIFLPLDTMPAFASPDVRQDLIQEINEKRKRRIDWDRLDPAGKDFQEIIYRLVKRDDSYFNESWGGTGPDQGKDGFCSIDLGGRETRILIQAKFNNDGSSINDKQVERSCRKASERHDCGGLIIGAVKTSGDLETEFEQGAFHTRDINYFRLWSGPEIKEKLSEHPDLIAEFFLE